MTKLNNTNIAPTVVQIQLHQITKVSKFVIVNIFDRMYYITYNYYMLLFNKYKIMHTSYNFIYLFKFIYYFTVI